MVVLVALTPCEERFRTIDQVGGAGVHHVLGDVARGALAAPFHLAVAPGNLVRAVTDLITVTLSGWTTVRVKKGYDYGAKVSLREMGASEATSDHMQSQDITKYGRMVERRVLAAVLDFLEDRGVDVAEYRQHSLTIMAGAFATNGATVNVGGDATGFQQNNATDGGSV